MTEQIRNEERESIGIRGREVAEVTTLGACIDTLCARVGRA